jgi:hypothetical protein
LRLDWYTFANCEIPVSIVDERTSFDLDAGQAQRPFRIFRLSSWRAFQKRQLTGWRMGVLVALIGTTLVCLFNIVVTIYILCRGNTKSGYGSLYSGDCKKTRDLNVWVHLVVNVLSTLLLSASNYCMQVLSAPTRDELVCAHARRLWLHIGIPSFRNLQYIARDRAYMWLALLLSSMPLHLFFNSVAFTTLQANDYFVIPTTEDWMSGAPYDTSGFSNITTNVTEMERTFPRLNRTALGFYTIDGVYEAKYNNLSAEECFNAYDSQYLPKFGNIYIVQSGSTIWRNLSGSTTNPLFSEGGTFQSSRHSKVDRKFTSPMRGGAGRGTRLAISTIPMRFQQIDHNGSPSKGPCCIVSPKRFMSAVA